MTSNAQPSKISTRQLLASIAVVVKYCEQQQSCQNCVLRSFGCDHWKCHMDAFDLRDVLSNIEAKRKNHGFI